MSKITLTKAYLCWLIISIAGWLVAWLTGSLWELMGQSVDLAGGQTSDISREQMILGFIVISLVYWAVSAGLLGIFVALTNKQKKLAKYVFIILCFYQIAYEIYGHYSILTTYQNPYALHDFLFAVLSVICVMIMLIKACAKYEKKLTM